MNARKLISPIAVDLGAKNTGVYMAQYEEGTKLQDLQNKQAFTLCLENGLTLMMVERTAARHQRRGYARRQMAKRLARLVLINAFDFNFDEHQEAISFLLNRRGRILGDDMDPTLFQNIPKELAKIATEELAKLNKEDSKQLKQLFPSDDVEDDSNDSLDITGSIETLIEKAYEESPQGLAEICESINKFNEAKSKKRRLSNVLKDNRSSEEQQEQAQKDLEEAEGVLQQYEKLSTNIFDFKQKYDEDDTTADDPSNQKKYYPYLVWYIRQVLQATITNIKTGHALRAIYLTHIKEDLSQYVADTSKSSDLSKSPEPIERKLSNLALEIKDCPKLDKSPDKRLDKFINLIGNISNMQLRGLRKYFLQEGAKQGDKWNAESFDKAYINWLKTLRPKQQKDKCRINEAMKSLKDNGNKIAESRALAALVELNPELTIPPFEDQNNRRPPTCRSLVMKPAKLDKHLPNWRNILKTIMEFYQKEHPELYASWQPVAAQTLNIFGKQKLGYAKILHKSGVAAEKIQELCWGINSAEDALAARALQVFLDLSRAHAARAEKAIPLLRSIKGDIKDDKNAGYTEFSNTLGKQIQNEHETGKEWERFLDFCRKYYEEIDYSMAGRWFPENAENLLDICNEKPRSKGYQYINDFGNLFGLNSEQVNQLIGSAGLEHWIKQIKGLKTHAESCAKLQKQVGNYLNEYLSLALDKEKRLEASRANKTSDTSTNDLKLSSEEKEYINVHNKSVRLAEALADKIQSSLKDEQLEIDPTKFNSVFTFAQLHNIVFTDRSGNAKNCPCCSVDNQGRMTRIKSSDSALATRLRGYIARPIDGVVRRLLDHKARLIAKEKVQQLKNTDKATEVRIPIITEQNKFSFEEELGKHKGKKSKRLNQLKKHTPAAEFNNKTTRIKQAGNNLCPYCGEAIVGDGEIDHIISRSSSKSTKQTIINSEANLIYVSSRANRKKDKHEYYLKDLHPNYLLEQFGTKEPSEIKNKIEQILEIPSYAIVPAPSVREQLKSIPVFKNFSNFLRLTPEAQKAFRHALFLAKDENARRLVEAVLNNSYKARVNGSQRYFASLVAEHINAEWARTKLPGVSIVYDYFEVPAEKVYELRHQDLTKIRSESAKAEKQAPYSHAIDAMLTFLTATEEPIVKRKFAQEKATTNELGLIPLEEELILKVDTKTGELVSTDNYEVLEVNESSWQKVEVTRNKPTSSYYLHRSIHRSSIYAMKFLPLLICAYDSNLRIGFTPDNSAEIGKKAKPDALLRTYLSFTDPAKKSPINSIMERSGIRAIADISEDNYQEFIGECQAYISQNRKEYLYLSIKPQLAHEFLIDKVNNTRQDFTEDTLEKAQLLSKVSYRTARNRVKDVLEKLLLDGDDEEENIRKQDDIKGNRNKIWGEIEGSLKLKCFNSNIRLPVYEEWKSLFDEILARNTSDELSKCIKSHNLEDWLKEHPVFKAQQGKLSRLHRRVKIVYSLPMNSGQGVFLQKRKVWSAGGKFIYQLINGPDPRSGNNYYLGAMLKDNRIMGGLQFPYTSSKMLYLQRLDELAGAAQAGEPINNRTWYKVLAIPAELQDMGIRELFYRIDDATSPSVRFEIERASLDSWDKLEALEQSAYLKPRDNSLSKAEQAYERVSAAAQKEENKEKRLPSRSEFMASRLREILDKISTPESEDLIIVTWKAKGAAYNKKLLDILIPAIKE